METTLSSDRLTPKLLSVLGKLNAIAQERGDSLADLALKWVLAHRGVTSVIIGASKTSQIADNLRAVEGTPLSPEEMAKIEAVAAE